MSAVDSDFRNDPALAKRLLAWLQPRQDKMAALLADLVAIPTENSPGNNYRRCADFLEACLRNAGLLCERYECNSEPHSPVCLIATHGHSERAIYFHGHY